MIYLKHPMQTEGRREYFAARLLEALGILAFSAAMLILTLAWNAGIRSYAVSGASVLCSFLGFVLELAALRMLSRSWEWVPGFQGLRSLHGQPRPRAPWWAVAPTLGLALACIGVNVGTPIVTGGHGVFPLLQAFACTALSGAALALLPKMVRGRTWRDVALCVVGASALFAGGVALGAVASYSGWATLTTLVGGVASGALLMVCATPIVRWCMRRADERAMRNIERAR